MKHDKRTQKRAPRKTGLLHVLFAKPKRLPATAVQEHDWDSDVPGIKLSTAFMVILFLHVAVVGGVMLFRFLEKDSDPALAGYESSKPAQGQAAAAGQGIRLDDPAVASLPKHMVKPHETLDMIAVAHGVTLDAIVRANRLNEDNRFRQGMVLVIPPPEASAQRVAESTGAPRAAQQVPVARAVEVANPPIIPAAPVPEPRVATARPISAENTTRPAIAVDAPVGQPKEHVVKAGETVWAISKKYGVSVADVLKANNLKDASKVKSGAKLRIPSAN